MWDKLVLKCLLNWWPRGGVVEKESCLPFQQMSDAHHQALSHCSHINDAPWGEFKMEKIRIPALDSYGAYPKNNFNKPRVLQSAPSQPHTAYRFVGLPCVSALPTQKPKRHEACSSLMVANWIALFMPEDDTSSILQKAEKLSDLICLSCCQGWGQKP